jgi:hypothetical protein
MTSKGLPKRIAVIDESPHASHFIATLIVFEIALSHAVDICRIAIEVPDHCPNGVSGVI